jgi:hypothetical protein
VIEIKSAYLDYEPPFDVERAVRRMLDLTPPEHLAGLRTIVLRNAAGLNHERRRSKTLSRKRKVAIARCRGLYHQRWKGEPAWIEIFVDNVFRDCPRPLLWFSILRESYLGDIVFHELGHHVHFTKVPEHREREDVAEKWKKRLGRIYFRKRFWYLLPALIPLIKLIKLVVPKRYLYPPKQASSHQ